MTEGTDELPCAKRQKTADSDDDDRLKIFNDFFKDKTQVLYLKAAYDSLIEGSSIMKLCLLKLVETNARLSEEFSRACCKVMMYEAEGPRVRTYSTGAIFRHGLFILKSFLDRKIPEDIEQQEALKKLLNFMAKDHSALLEAGKCDESHWVFLIAQHLLFPLSVADHYTVDDKYSGIGKIAQRCPCKAGDSLYGNTDDTSFGLVEGWHGRTDIVVNDVAVDLAVVDPNVTGMDEELEIGSSAVSLSLSSTEEKSTTNFKEKDIQQLIAQTIVFSFLQRKEGGMNMKNCLVPGVGISKQKVISYFYDCEADVLLGTTHMKLYGYKNSLCYNTVVFLWLTLNYKIFCSGITNSMEQFKAEFVNRVGDYIDDYRNNVTRRAHKEKKDSEKEGDWATCPLSEIVSVDETGENLGIKIKMLSNMC